MFKKIGVLVVALFSLLSVIFVSENQIAASTLPSPQFLIEGKTRETVGSTSNTCLWKENDSNLLTNNCGIIFSEYNPNVMTVNATVTLDDAASGSEARIIIGNIQRGGIYLGVLSGKYIARLYSNEKYTTLLGTPVVPGKETVITSTYDGNVAKLYIDGIFVSEAIIGVLTPPALNTAWAVGANPSGNEIEQLKPQYFNGQIKNVAVWQCHQLKVS